MSITWRGCPTTSVSWQTRSSKRGRLGEAETTIRTALDIARAQNEGWCLPELLRIQASILTAQGQTGEAEAILVESMALAREIGALSWRLRAANDLAKLWRARSRTDDARRMLLPIYNEFTEGFATRDLMVAADLLASLARPGDGEAASRCGCSLTLASTRSDAIEAFQPWLRHTTFNRA